MGIDADIIVIGPAQILIEANVQDYPRRDYDGVSKDAIVLGTVATAYTIEESLRLAELCQVDVTDLGNHRVKNVLSPLPREDHFKSIGSDLTIDVWRTIRVLLQYDDVQMWYRPNY